MAVGNLSGTPVIGASATGASNGAIAIPITERFSSYITNNTAAIAATLADGAVGQLKIIKLETHDTNDMVLTPAHYNDGTTITFDASDEFAILIFVGSGWTTINTNATIG